MYQPFSLLMTPKRLNSAFTSTRIQKSASLDISTTVRNAENPRPAAFIQGIHVTLYRPEPNFQGRSEGPKTSGFSEPQERGNHLPHSVPQCRSLPRLLAIMPCDRLVP